MNTDPTDPIERLVDAMAEVKAAIQEQADQRVEWIRSNARKLMEKSGLDIVTVLALADMTEEDRPVVVEGMRHAMAAVLAIGVTFGDLDRPPDEFEAMMGNLPRSALIGAMARRGLIADALEAASG